MRRIYHCPLFTTTTGRILLFFKLNPSAQPSELLTFRILHLPLFLSPFLLSIIACHFCFSFSFSLSFSSFYYCSSFLFSLLFLSLSLLFIIACHFCFPFSFSLSFSSFYYCLSFLFSFLFLFLSLLSIIACHFCFFFFLSFFLFFLLLLVISVFPSLSLSFSSFYYCLSFLFFLLSFSVSTDRRGEVFGGGGRDGGSVTLEGSAEAMRWSDPLAGRPVTDGGWTSIGRTARFNYHNRYLSFSSLQRGGGRGESLPSGSINPEKVSGIVVWQRDGRRPSGRLHPRGKKEGRKGRKKGRTGESRRRRRRRRRRKDIHAWSCARAYLHAVCAEYVRRGVGILSIGSPSE